MFFLCTRCQRQQHDTLLRGRLSVTVTPAAAAINTTFLCSPILISAQRNEAGTPFNPASHCYYYGCHIASYLLLTTYYIGMATATPPTRSHSHLLHAHLNANAPGEKERRAKERRARRSNKTLAARLAYLHIF